MHAAIVEGQLVHLYMYIHISLLFANNFNPHKKPTPFLNLTTCTQSMQRTYLASGEYCHCHWVLLCVVKIVHFGLMDVLEKVFEAKKCLIQMRFEPRTSGSTPNALQFKILRPDIFFPMFLNTGSGNIEIFLFVKLTFLMLNLHGCQHSFFSAKWMFLRNNHSLLGRKCRTPSVTWTNNLRIHVECSTIRSVGTSHFLSHAFNTGQSWRYNCFTCRFGVLNIKWTQATAFVFGGKLLCFFKKKNIKHARQEQSIYFQLTIALPIEVPGSFSKTHTTQQANTNSRKPNHNNTANITHTHTNPPQNQLIYTQYCRVY